MTKPTSPQDDDENSVAAAVGNWRCPFCGGTAVHVRMTSLPPRMDGPGALVSCEIGHECRAPTPGTLIATRRVRARDVPTAIVEWMRGSDNA